MTIEFARHVLGLTQANSTEFDPSTTAPVIDLMNDQREVSNKGGTMRLGAYYAVLAPGSQVAAMYGEPVVSERHRHRYEFNAQFRTRFEESGFLCSGTSPDKRLVEFIELTGHPVVHWPHQCSFELSRKLTERLFHIAALKHGLRLAIEEVVA